MEGWYLDRDDLVVLQMRSSTTPVEAMPMDLNQPSGNRAKTGQKASCSTRGRPPPLSLACAFRPTAAHLELNSGWNCAATKNGWSGGLSESSRISILSPVSSLPTNCMPLASSSGTKLGLTSYLLETRGGDVRSKDLKKKAIRPLYKPRGNIRANS